jgi:hypothetical protein
MVRRPRKEVTKLPPPSENICHFCNRELKKEERLVRAHGTWVHEACLARPAPTPSEPTPLERRAKVHARYMDAWVRAGVLRQTAAYLCDEASAIAAKSRSLVKSKERKKRSRRPKSSPPSA